MQTTNKLYMKLYIKQSIYKIIKNIKKYLFEVVSGKVLIILKMKRRNQVHRESRYFQKGGLIITKPR